MRYPTGKSNQDFLTNWYDAQGFGNKTSYGYHEGHDYNKKTGGDSDLGENLIAVANGKIVYYHNASHPSTGFGRHMVLECETSRGKRWYHYCHCQEITAETKEVKEGDVIGKLGKSGTTLAHLHFSVFKVDPSTLTKGIDSIATNTTNLNAWWEKFELLTTTGSMEKTFTQAEWQLERDERNKNWQLYQDQLEVVKKLKIEVESLNKTITDIKLNQDKEVISLKKTHSEFVENLLTILNGSNPLGLSSEELVVKLVQEAISKETSLQAEIKALQKTTDQEKADLIKENKELKEELERLQGEFISMEQKHQVEIEMFKKRLDNVQAQFEENQEEVIKVDSFKTFIEALIRIFKKG